MPEVSNSQKKFICQQDHGSTVEKNTGQASISEKDENEPDYVLYWMVFGVLCAYIGAFLAIIFDVITGQNFIPTLKNHLPDFFLATLAVSANLVYLVLVSKGKISERKRSQYGTFALIFGGFSLIVYIVCYQVFKIIPWHWSWILIAVSCVIAGICAYLGFRIESNR